MRDLAQTNLQLYNQLVDLGWDDADLVAVRDAYALASELFSGLSRPTDKAFLAHLVGTASVLAAAGERPAVVEAGLLHAAYTLGEFGDGSRGYASRKRRELVGVVGTDVEGLIAAYTGMVWHPGVLPGLHARATALDAEERDVVVISLANEVDEWLDAGIRYCAADPERRRAFELLIALAEQIGVPRIAQDLRRVSAFDASVDVPEVLVLAAQESFFRPPRAYRPRSQLAARLLLRRPAVARARRAVRRRAKRLAVVRWLRDRVARP